MTPSEYTAHAWPDEPGRYAHHAHPDERRSVLPCADTDRCPPSSQHTDREARVTVLPLPPLPRIEE